MVKDYYEDAKIIAEKLKNKDYHDYGKEIYEIIESGISSTEILMRLRFALNKIQVNDIVKLTDIDKRIKELIHEIDTALK